MVISLSWCSFIKHSVALNASQLHTNTPTCTHTHCAHKCTHHSRSLCKKLPSPRMKSGTMQTSGQDSVMQCSDRHCSERPGHCDNLELLHWLAAPLTLLLFLQASFAALAIALLFKLLDLPYQWLHATRVAPAISIMDCSVRQVCCNSKLASGSLWKARGFVACHDMG
jgi:hypothetical protein